MREFFLFFGAQRRRGAKKKTLCGLAALRANFFFSQRNKEIKPFESFLPKVGRLCVNFFVVWRAKAQRRKEIGEDFSDLPEVGKLGTFV